MRYLIHIALGLYVASALSHCVASEPSTPESEYLKYCGTCHLPPQAENLPLRIWTDHVLPDMAARLGYRYMDYDPYAKTSLEENLHMHLSNAYPDKPLLDSVSWNRIVEYITHVAPDTLLSSAVPEVDSLTRFVPHFVSGDGRPAQITNLQFDFPTQELLIGDGYGNAQVWMDSIGTQRRFHSPIISQVRNQDIEYITEVGNIKPSEQPLGALYRLKGNTLDTLAYPLHRPVYTQIADLDSDGTNEVLVCEFGNLTGQLSLLVQQGADATAYGKRTLLGIPGIIKTELSDMNGDGRMDIIALASQGNEGIYILYQLRDLRFEIKQVIRLEPEYGSSWFELIDFDKDGDRDIVLVNGDNADLSNVLKPYHGLRVYINAEKELFTEAYFYPLYGATRVCAEDFDRDGDIDFAVLAYFPDFLNGPEKGFVYLENISTTQLSFHAYTTPVVADARWLVMEKGDFDHDGDTDVMLGAFALPPEKKSEFAYARWKEKNYTLCFLENSLQ